MNKNIEYANTAEQIAREAGVLLKRNISRPHTVTYKGRKNLVTEMDKQSEAIAIKRIRAKYPEHGILSEESGVFDKPESEYKWIIDPLDGTTNYAHGFNFFGVSIGLTRQEKIIAGVVYDPMRDELFKAAKGCGAYLNKNKIKVSSVTAIKESLLSTGFPYKLGKVMKKNIGYFVSFMMKAQAIRRPGSASLDLCYVAAGRFDGFWEMELHPWDTAAGVLIVEEAGGKVTDFSGNTFDPFKKQIVASNSRIHRQMLDVLGR